MSSAEECTEQDPRVEPYLNARFDESGTSLVNFDLSFNTEETSFEIFGLTREEIERIIRDIKEQLDLWLEVQLQFQRT